MKFEKLTSDNFFKYAKKRIIGSLFSSYAIQFSSKILSILTQIITARFFLTTEQFGIFAYILFIFTIINNLRDFGLSNHLIRIKEVNYSLVFTIFLYLSAAITAGHFIYAAAAWSSNKEFALPLVIMSLAYIPTALGSIPSIYISRNLLIQKTLFARIFSMLGFFIFATIFSFMGFGTSSLTGAKLIQSLIFTVWVWLIVKDNIKIKLQIKNGLALIKDAYKFFINDNLGLITENIYNYVIGLFTTFARLAIYRVGISLIFLPIKVIELSFYKIVLPFFSKLRPFPDRLGHAYAVFSILIVCLEVPIYAFIFYNTKIIILLTFGIKYIESAEIMRYLCFLPIISIYTTFGIELIKSLKKDNLLLTYIFTGSFFIILFSFILTKKYGIYGTAIANYLGMNMFIIIYFVYKHFRKDFFYITVRIPLIYGLPFFTMWLLTKLNTDIPLIKNIFFNLHDFFLLYSSKISNIMLLISDNSVLVLRSILTGFLVLLNWLVFYFVLLKKDLKLIFEFNK